MADHETLSRAKIKLAESRAEREVAEARKWNAEAEIFELDLERDHEKRKLELAANHQHHKYIFDSEVSGKSVKDCISTLQKWARLEPGCDVEITMNSPGGSIFDGFALVDFIRDLRAQGHEVTIVGLGIVASMAGVILQAGTKRVLSENSIFLIHEGSLGAIGDFGAVEDRVELMKLFHERILSLFVTRAEPINKRTTKGFIKRNWKRKDWWMSAGDAVKLGFADEVR